MDHRQAVSYYSECEKLAVLNFNQLCDVLIRLLTGDWLLFPALKSVNTFRWMVLCSYKYHR